MRNEFYLDEFAFVKTNSIENGVNKLLFRLGFKSKLKGTEYLKESIVLKYNDNLLRCKDIYPKIAQKHDVSSSSVERAIRNTLNNCYVSGKLAAINEMCRFKIIDEKYVPTNSEFICEISTWIQLVKDDDDEHERK